MTELRLNLHKIFVAAFVGEVVLMTTTLMLF